MRIRWLLIISLLTPLTSCQTSKNEFTITWQNVDGTILEVDSNVPKGAKPTYDRGAPTYGPIREEGSTSGTSYYFSGWDSELVEVNEDKTYTATYTTKPNYDVKWVNADGKVLQHLKYVVEGNKPIYNDELPHKEPEGTTYFAFTGWNEEQHDIISDTTYIAQYDSEGITESSDYDCDGLVDYDDPDYKSAHNNVSYKYEGDSGKFDFAIDYYDYFINQNNEEYSSDVAKFLAALNIDAFYTGHITFPHEKCDFNNKKYIYERLGCDHIEEFFVEKDDEPDDVGGAIMAHHTIKANSVLSHPEITEDQNIFFITVKASREDNIPLWRSDLDIGSDDSSYNEMTGSHPLWTDHDYHKGLFISSNRVKEEVDKYLSKSEFSSLPNKILVISGHSRGATTANYIAKQYQDNDDYKKFAYTFGSPDYYFGNDSTNVPYIFNFLNDDDLIAHIPFSYFNGKRYGNDIRFSIDEECANEYRQFASHSYNTLVNIEDFIINDVQSIIPDRESIYILDDTLERCKGFKNVSLIQASARKEYEDDLLVLNKYGINTVIGEQTPYHLYYDGDKTVTGYNCPYAFYKIAFAIAEMSDVEISDLLDLLKVFNNYQNMFDQAVSVMGLEITDPMPKIAYPHQMSTYYVMASHYVPEL